jgi:hypothetical protein
MATNFPEELDSFINPLSTDSVAVVSHSEQHSNANDAIEALEAKVGKDGSTDPVSLDYRVSALENSSVDPNEIKDIAAEILDHQDHTNITVTYDDIENKLILTSESGVADSTTDDLDEGTNNLYFTNQRALDATSTAYDPAGAAADALTDANSYTDGAVSALVNGAPELLDTLNELAAAINDDASFASTIATSIGEKQDTLTAGSNIDITGAIISVTGLSTDDVAEDVGNLYFTNQRALDATAAAYDVVGSGAGALEQANDYTDGEITTALTTAQGYADTAQQNAESYADGLAVNYDAAGAAATAETNANTYTDTALNDYTPTSTLDTTVGGYGYLKSADLSGYATESYVGTAIGNIIEGAPALLDTLNELAAAIGDDENFVTTINNALATKITASSTDTLTNKTISIQSGLTSVVGFDDITGFFGQSDIVVLQDAIDKGGRINISSEGVITQSAAGTGYVTGLGTIGGGTRVAIGTSNNTLTGKLSDFNAALLDADFATTVDITNAIQDANDYSDGLAVNYDPAGAAATAQSNAEDYTDTAISSLGDDIEAGYIPVTEKATAGGVASLDLSGKVPDTQLDIDSTIQDVASSMITGGTHTNISTSFDNVTKKLSFSTTPLTQDQIQDFVAPLFTHTQHTNVTATYDDDNNRIVLSASGGSGGGASVTISPTAPTGPTLGNIWLDSDNGSTFIWDGVYWVEIGGASTAEAIAAVTSTAPSNPSLGRIWLNSTTAKTYIYDGSYWVEV